MVPFRVYDRDQQQMWQVINYHPAQDGQGAYLMTKEDDSESDGEIQVVSANIMKKFKFIEFIEESESSLE